MERGSNQHGPRIDDELEREVESLTRGSPVESRAVEWRQQEAPADDEPVPDSRVAAGDIDLTALEMRSELAASLRPSAFPATSRRLREVALEQQARPWVVDAIETLPRERIFHTPQEIWEQIGGEPAERRPPADEAPQPEASETVTTPSISRPNVVELIISDVVGVAKTVGFVVVGAIGQVVERVPNPFRDRRS